MTSSTNIATRARWCAAFTTVALATSLVAQAQVNVLMNRYDPSRTGANLKETTLTTANVNVNQFGKLYSYPVDGSVYAQPLYMEGVTINGVTHNVLFVATMNDHVYAFDADRSSATPLWTANFTNPPSVTPVPITDITAPDRNIVGNVGIQGTPVIDSASRTLFLVARTKENGSYVQRLHALDITTGRERSGSPVKITASVSGNAPDATAGSSGNVITFDPKVHVQRAGLALVNGVVLIAWAAHEDLTPSHGWIMGFDAATLARVAAMVVTPDVYGGGIWQGGRAPAVDASGNVYFATGNGTWDGTRNFGDSVLKLGVSRSGLSLLDYFTPSNEQALNSEDDDLSGSGFTLLPGTSLLLGGGKEGVLYLLNKDNLGRKVSNDTQIVQKLALAGGHVMGGPVYWKSATAGPLVYNWSENDYLKAYRLSGGTLVTPPFAQGQVVSPGHPGGSLTISANGSTARTGIVWASMPTDVDGIHGLVAGVLRAFDAETMKEIWNSEQKASRDRAGTLMKFVPPVVARGRVYIPSHDNAVHVYGSLSAATTVFGAIGINFVGGEPNALGASETAGVVPQTHWNNAIGSARTSPLALVDQAGAATGASATWNAGGTWMTPITDAAGNRRMMKGYLDTSSTSTTMISVTGLPPRTYDVYVYVDGDNKSYDRTGAYTISGSGITPTTIELTDAANTNFSSTFKQASNSPGNYVKFTVTAGAFTVTAVPGEADSTTRRAPVNGIQIVPSASASTAPRGISVNFVGSSTTVMAATEAAGVVSKSHWNNASGGSRSTPLPLADEAGTRTSATVVWSASGVWTTPISDTAGNARMMKGYLDTSSTSSTIVTVAGLASATYDVYVYADGDNRNYSRTAAYRISGTGITTTTAYLTDAAGMNYSGTFIRASNSNGNYVKFTFAGTGFTLRATPLSGGSSTLRAPINGIQIVPR
jgi:PQQ-like domain